MWRRSKKTCFTFLNTLTQTESTLNPSLSLAVGVAPTLTEGIVLASFDLRSNYT